MTAPDARQSDELRKGIRLALAQWSVVPLSHLGYIADALLPVVTAWHEKAAEAQARARAAEELRKAAEWAETVSPTFPAWQLQKLAAALAADDRTDPA